MGISVICEGGLVNIRRCVSMGWGAVALGGGVPSRAPQGRDCAAAGGGQGGGVGRRGGRGGGAAGARSIEAPWSPCASGCQRCRYPRRPNEMAGCVG
jgi:hypothetical protein